MFNELYKKSMDDVKPDEVLVQRTKNLMHKELKKKPKRFYKYATIAACLLITFSLFRVTFQSANNSITIEDAHMGNVSELNGGAIKGYSTINNSTDSLNGSIPFGSSHFEASASSSSTQNEGNIFIRIIKSIVVWFKNIFNI